jgi:hypothetical protein
MIEQLLVGQLFTISSSTKVFHLNAPPLLDDLIGLSFELNHRREVSLNGISSPYLSVNNTIKRPTKFFNGSQAS